jgi:ribosomal protein S18 acetylase RimI-like enzyme
MPLFKAAIKDIPSLVRLINSAYRGEASKSGWTSEADMVDGEIRTDPEQLAELMRKQEVAILLYTNDKNEPEGSVFLEKRGNKLYLGMLSVSPELQARGTGRKLMAAAEEYAREQQCNTVFMRVISIRHELIAWYERQGYSATGEIQPFEDGRFGTANRPIEFIVMEKPLNT